MCPFGAVFSAHFWARLGGFFLKLLHQFCWLAPAGFLYVDDMLMFQDVQMLPLSAATIAILCLLSRLPISWKKCEFGPTITWIGWQIHICGFICIPIDKRRRLLTQIQKLTSSNHGSKKALEQFLGLALWRRTQVGLLFRRTNELNTYNSAETITDPRSVLLFLR